MFCVTNKSIVYYTCSIFNVEGLDFCSHYCCFIRKRYHSVMLEWILWYCMILHNLYFPWLDIDKTIVSYVVDGFEF